MMTLSKTQEHDNYSTKCMAFKVWAPLHRSVTVPMTHDSALTGLCASAQYAFQPGEARELQLAKEQPADFFKSKQFKCVDPPKCTIRQQV